MEENIKRVEHLIERCNQCKMHECIECEICWSEVQSIEELLERYKNIKRANSDLQCEQEQLYDKIDKMKEVNEKLTEYNRAMFKEQARLEEENRRCHKTISAMRVIKNTSRYEDTILLNEELCATKNTYKVEVENGKFIDVNELYEVYKNSIPKSKVKQKMMELEYEQAEGKNICENRYKIDVLKEMMEE